jgi:hypothetical protein
MLNSAKPSQLDLTTIDLSSITPEEREVVMREVLRRAHAERNKVMHDLMTQLWSWVAGRQAAMKSAPDTSIGAEDRLQPCDARKGR